MGGVLVSFSLGAMDWSLIVAFPDHIFSTITHTSIFVYQTFVNVQIIRFNKYYCIISRVARYLHPCFNL